MKEITRLAAEEFVLETGKRVRLERWQVSKEDERVNDSVPAPSYVQARSAMDVFHGERLIGPRRPDEPGVDPRVRCLLPFAVDSSFARDFAAYRQIKSEHATLEEEEARRPDLARRISRYARLRLNLLNPKLDELATRLCGFEREGDSFKAKIAPSNWSFGRTSMDAGNIPLVHSPGDDTELRELVRDLIRHFGYGMTLREAYSKEWGKAGKLPSFDSGACAWQLGTCSVSWVKRSGQFSITRRGRGVGGLNTGRVCAASGGVHWSPFQETREKTPERNRGHEFTYVLDWEIGREFTEEVGCVHHAEPDPFSLHRLGFAREVPRMGSPEFFYRFDFEGDPDGLAEIIAQNTHPESEEIDCIVYALAPEDAIALLTSPDGADIIHYKGLMNLYWAITAMNIPEFRPIF